MRPSNKGLIAEYEFLKECALRNWEVSRPEDPSLPYDFVVRYGRGGTFYSVQVKQASRSRSGNRTPNREVNFRRCVKGRAIKAKKRAYVEGDFDYLVVHDNGKLWLFPWEEISHIKSSLVVSAEKYRKFILNERNILRGNFKKTDLVLQ